jgi:hypothetical protein
MATDTIRIQRIKPQIGFAGVAGIAIDGSMDTQQREGNQFVHAGYILYDPRITVVASGTIISDGLLVNVGMTG